MTTPLVVPPLWCPIPPAIHPEWRRMEAGAVAFAEKFGLYSSLGQLRRLSRIGVGELASRVTPRARNVDALQISTDCHMWLFAFDDAYCDEGSFKNETNALISSLMQHARLVQVSHPTPTSGNNYAAALHDMRYRLESCASPVQVKRWEQAMRDYLFAEAGLAAYRASGELPGVNDYIAIRMGSSAVGCIAAFFDIVDDAEVRAEEMERADVRAITEMTIAIGAWDNDIVSHRKETVRSGDDQNLVDVLAKERRCSLSQALSMAISMRDRTLTHFTWLRDRVGETAGPELANYLDNCESYIRGNLQWSLGSHRYTNAMDGAPMPTTFAEKPTDGMFEPLDIPAVAWWWTV